MQVDGEDSEFPLDFLKAVARFGVVQDDASIEKHACVIQLVSNRKLELDWDEQNYRGRGLGSVGYLPFACSARGFSRCSTCFRIS